MDQAKFKDIISNRHKGIVASVMRLLFRICSTFYSLIICLRNSLYNKGALKAHSVPKPVISIGNITAGGTGKTPLVIWLAKHLSDKYKPAVLTRGYKSQQTLLDEISMITDSCGAAIIVNSDRVAGANEAITSGADVLIMDDGFQHRRLARDIDIVTIDATHPFGYGKVLPAGLLREPLSFLKRAHAVIITRIDQASKHQLKELELKLIEINPSLVLARAVHKPITFIDANTMQIPIEQMQNKKAFAFCAIGNPGSFIETLKSLDIEITDSVFFDDHHHYSKTDFDSIVKLAQSSNADLILTTEKDYSKIQHGWITKNNINFAHLKVEIELITGCERITQLIDKALECKISTSA